MGSKVDKTKRALIGAGGRILFYPTLFYNLVRFKLQSQFRWWDQIDEYLLMGAVPFRKDVSRLKHLGVGGVITLNEPFETLVPSSLYNALCLIPKLLVAATQRLCFYLNHLMILWT
ncbi:PREDICTED: putative dual specificity protein phosphatase DSP8 isoform X1 [Camelina sativa]|uniref:Dual specificity protein phosphatase DSP8 isoform X1 n=1 Tax=Camelina sativa TaxID=90675 RepID=A0ABM0UYW7_CAMSA|nr:PREDICTED: putative dual specificity protein phosphatase DSP8 isoform X1 [Camelina sativa]